METIDERNAVIREQEDQLALRDKTIAEQAARMLDLEREVAHLRSLTTGGVA